MKEVKSPRKPLIYYYGIVLLVILVFNMVISPLLANARVKEVDYGTFMKMIEDKDIGSVEVADSEIVFTRQGQYPDLQDRRNERPHPDRAAVCIGS